MIAVNGILTLTFFFFFARQLNYGPASRMVSCDRISSVNTSSRFTMWNYTRALDRLFFFCGVGIVAERICDRKMIRSATTGQFVRGFALVWCMVATAVSCASPYRRNITGELFQYILLRHIIILLTPWKLENRSGTTNQGLKVVR